MEPMVVLQQSHLVEQPTLQLVVEVELVAVKMQ